MTLPVTQQNNAVSVPSLQPQNMTEAMQVAEFISRAQLVPDCLQNKPADCFMVIQQAVQWGMSPLAVAQGCSVVHGKLMLEGKLVAAAVNSLAGLKSNLNYRYEGEGEKRSCTAFGTLQGEDEPREATVVYSDVATKQWKMQEADQRLAYSAARQWARRHTPEVIMGVYSKDEAPHILQEQAKTAADILDALEPEVIDVPKEKHDWTLEHTEWSPDMWHQWRNNTRLAIGKFESKEALNDLNQKIAAKVDFLQDQPELKSIVDDLKEAATIKLYQLTN